MAPTRRNLNADLTMLMQKPLKESQEVLQQGTWNVDTAKSLCPFKNEYYKLFIELSTLRVLLTAQVQPIPPKMLQLLSCYPHVYFANDLENLSTKCAALLQNDFITFGKIKQVVDAACLSPHTGDIWNLGRLEEARHDGMYLDLTKLYHVHYKYYFYAPKQYHTKENALLLVKAKPDAYQLLDVTLQADVDIFFQAATLLPSNVQYAPHNLVNNHSLMEQLVKQNARVFLYCNEAIQDNELIAKLAIAQHYANYAAASLRLRSKRELLELALNAPLSNAWYGNSSIMHAVPSHLMLRNYIWQALEKNPNELQHIPQTKEYILFAISKSPRLSYLINKSFLSDYEFLKQLVTLYKDTIYELPENCITDELLQCAGITWSKWYAHHDID